MMDSYELGKEFGLVCDNDNVEPSYNWCQEQIETLGYSCSDDDVRGFQLGFDDGFLLRRCE